MPTRHVETPEARNLEQKTKPREAIARVRIESRTSSGWLRSRAGN